MQRRFLLHTTSASATVSQYSISMLVNLWNAKSLLRYAQNNSCSYSEAGFRSIYAPSKNRHDSENTQEKSDVVIERNLSQAKHLPSGQPATVPHVPYFVPQMIPDQSAQNFHPSPPGSRNALNWDSYLHQNTRSVHLREISSFLALFQYCMDHNLKFLLVLVCLISGGLIDLWTSTLYFGFIDENKLILPAFLFYLFGLCNGRALIWFCLSILLYKLPSHLSFVVQDERGVSTRPSAVRWQIGNHEISSSIIFSIGVAVSLVRLTIPLQIFFARAVFSM